jgi:hypothetical protein
MPLIPRERGFCAHWIPPIIQGIHIVHIGYSSREGKEEEVVYRFLCFLKSCSECLQTTVSLSEFLNHHYNHTLRSLFISE